MAMDNPADYTPKSAPKPKEEEEEVPLISPSSQQDKASKDKAILHIRSIADKISSNPLQNSEPTVWAVLTAVSARARKRPQGINILLNADEHFLGRSLEDPHFQIEGAAVSSRHCKIYRKQAEDTALTSGSSTCFFLKDTSTNGTYLNNEKLRKQGPEVKIQHGDIISFATPPHYESSLAFVFREVNKFICGTKRKQDENVSEGKRMKGLGIGAPEGPISLDDIRSLQRSNTELRKQLESHVHTIETMRNETRETALRHENSLKELKESASNSYLDQIKELHHMLEVKQKELVELTSTSCEREHTIKDLNERLSASIQSRVDADEVIHSQKTTISELEIQLNEERNLRKEEREKASVDLKAALQKAHSETQEEIKRQADAALIQQREQQEIINKLQESDKESRVLVETLRSKLECTRESLVMSEKKVRQLEAQLHEEEVAAVNGKKKAEMMESEVERLKKELENEKVAREEAWAKVSALELEIAAAIRDLAMEKQRFQGAREKIILRETQLRAFYSTTEEISALFVKQQEQLKAMQKTLEDEENYENTSLDIDLNVLKASLNGALDIGRGQANQRNVTAREASGTSTPKNTRIATDNSGDDATATEKHDCDMRSQDDGCTQDVECTSADPSVKGFGSYIGTAPAMDDAFDTERVLGTETEALDVGFSQTVAIQRCSNIAGDTMQLDDEVQENGEQHERIDDEDTRCSQSNNEVDDVKAMEDTEVGTIRTADLLASEVAGSWAGSTAPSVHGENESPRSGAHGGSNNDNNEAGGDALCTSDGQAAGSQNAPTNVATGLSQERQALKAIIGIVAPEFNTNCSGGADENMSDSDTKEGSDGDDDEDEDAMMRKERSKDGSGHLNDNSNEEDNEYEDETEDDSLG